MSDTLKDKVEAAFQHACEKEEANERMDGYASTFWQGRREAFAKVLHWLNREDEAESER